MSEFLDDPLVAKPGNILFCLCCSTEVAIKKSATLQHTKSQGHLTKLAKHKKNKARLLTIDTLLNESDNGVTPYSGKTLPNATRVHRLNVSIYELFRRSIPLFAYVMFCI